MKTLIYLIRHGETEWNKLGRFQGCVDIELSQNGIIQAEVLRDKYENDFDYIYSSPLKRAYATAEILAAPTGKKPLLAQNLREINFGQWEGLTLNEIKNTYGKEYTLWKQDKLEGVLCGGDGSLKCASTRAVENILEIVKAHQGSKVAVIAHGGIIKASLIGIFGWDMTMYHKMFLNNTSVTIVRFDENMNPVLVTFNDTNHLIE